MTLIKLIFLILGTALTAAYVLLTFRGQKYDPFIEKLPKEGFSDKELWAAGYAMQEMRVFSLESPIGQKLMGQAKLLHPENEGKYAEYWTRLYLARTLSLSLMTAAFVFCATGFMEGIMVALTPIVGLVAVYAVYDSGANAMTNELKKRSDACLMEFSNVVSKLALLMNTGMILRNAWFVVARSKEGPIYYLMKNACDSMNNGKSDIDAIYEFGVQSNTPEIRKFAGILIQNMSKGGSDMTIFLTQQSRELWSHKRQLMLRKGDEAAAKLLMPTMLMLLGILLIIIVSAMAGMNLSI